MSCPVTLEEIRPAERLENSDISAAILRGLKDLAVEFGNEIKCPILLRGRPEAAERVMPLVWRKKISESYLQVARGNRMGWCWDSLYGDRVTAFICRIAALSTPSSSSSSIQSTPQDAPDSSIPRPVVLQEITRMNTSREDIRKTSRGASSLYNEKGKSHYFRKAREEKENRTDEEMRGV